MPKNAFWMLLSGIAFLAFGEMRAQQVIVARDESAPPPVTTKKQAPAQLTTAAQPSPKQDVPKASPVTESAAKAQPVITKPAGTEKAKSQPNLIMVARAPSATSPATHPSPVRSQSPAPAVTAKTSANPVKSTPGLPAPRTMRLTKVEGPPPEPQSQLPLGSQESTSRFVRGPLETAFVRMADGFDFPIGKPDAQGYYKARGFRSTGHLGEDWDGIGGGDTDLRDPIYCIGDGIVVFARDCHMGWGNVLIVRHSYREGGMVKNVDSFYGHLDRILVNRGQVVSRGQQIATMGNAHGLYDAHLHLEIRKNIEIGMSRAKFAQDSSNYYDPTQFINAHRHLQGGGASYRVAMNTFAQDSRINWAAVKNYSHSRHRGGTRESANALKKAIAKKN